MYLVGLVVDAVNKGIGSHSYVEVGVAQPLDSFFNVGHSSQSHLVRGVKQNMHKRIQIKGRESFVCPSHITFTAFGRGSYPGRLTSALRSISEYFLILVQQDPGPKNTICQELRHYSAVDFFRSQLFWKL